MRLTLDWGTFLLKACSRWSDEKKASLPRELDFSPSTSQRRSLEGKIRTRAFVAFSLKNSQPLGQFECVEFIDNSPSVFLCVFNRLLHTLVLQLSQCGRFPFPCRCLTVLVMQSTALFVAGQACPLSQRCGGWSNTNWYVSTHHLINSGCMHIACKLAVLCKLAVDKKPGPYAYYCYLYSAHWIFATLSLYMIF